MAAILAQQSHSEPSQETCRLLVDGVVGYHFDPHQELVKKNRTGAEISKKYDLLPSPQR